jgi:PadR family transcriptional regulator AphA
MNKLSFGLLSFLLTESQSGYDLKLRLNQFWHTNHSAIYPLLSELEEKQYVTYSLIGQSTKPDKKIYNITEQGKEVLKEWIVAPNTESIPKDEMMLKIYCIQGLDAGTVDKLLTETEERYRKLLEKYTESLEKIKANVNNNFDSYNPQLFGSYLLIQKVICDSNTGILWCKWIRQLYGKKNAIDWIQDSFTDYSEK